MSARLETEFRRSQAIGQAGRVQFQASAGRRPGSQARRRRNPRPDEAALGALPERAREQMLQLPAEEFLPKYELEIEDYFRRLAGEGEK